MASGLLVKVQQTCISCIAFTDTFIGARVDKVIRIEDCFVWFRFQVLTAMSMKMIVFWDVAPCSLV
jgi:hypothetical protein